MDAILRVAEKEALERRKASKKSPSPKPEMDLNEFILSKMKERMDIISPESEDVPENF